MLGTMAARKGKADDQDEQAASITVSTRLTPEELAKLDQIAEETPFQPSRSQLVAHAVREFLKQHAKGGK